VIEIRTAAGPRRRPPGRRQLILEAAAELMAERGFHDVGIAEIGAAAGVSGSAIYRHFDGKAAVLVAMFDRVIDDLARDAEAVVTSELSSVEQLRALISTQVRFVRDDRKLLQVYHNENANLPADDRRRLRRKQRLYLEEWVHVLAVLRPELSDAHLRTLVHGAIGAIQSVLFFTSGLPDDQLTDLLVSVAEAATSAPTFPIATTAR
jgi:AcrR family transcriptional regulator